MAHNIFKDENGKAAFFSVKQKAWHGLGTIVEDYPSSSEALEFAGLDFDVIKAPNIHRLPNGNEIVSDASFFTYRDDNNAVLGDKLGPGYNVVQNRDAFTFFDSIVGGEGIMYETAGALGKGEKIFITAKLPNYIKVGKDDLIEKYIFLTTHHDGSGSITAAFTPVRIVCANTLAMAMGNMSNVVRIRHTKSAKDRLKEAHKIMGITNKLSDNLNEIFNSWAKIKISDKNVQRLIQEAMAPSKEVLDMVKFGNDTDLSTAFNNICEDAYEYAMADETQQTDTTKGTLFGAYNAVTGYFQNVKNFKTGEDKLNSIMYGTGLQRGQTAFRLCDNYAKNGGGIFTLN